MQEHHSVLTYAIENRLRVSFKYKSTDEEVATLRIVEPWVHGYRNNKECLLGYQVSPETMTRRFDLRRVKYIEVLEDSNVNRPEQIDLTKWDVIHSRWVPQPEAA